MRWRATRGIGVVVGGIASLWLVALGVALVVRAATADVTFGAFVLYAAGMVALALAAIAGYWTYACATLSYALDEAAVRVRWGLRSIVVPLNAVDIVVHADAPDAVRGLNWPGHHVGQASLDGDAIAYVYATEFAGGRAVYLRASDLILAITPDDPAAFVREAEHRRRGAPPLIVEPAAPEFDARSLARDVVARGLLFAAVVLNVVMFGIVFARYEDLPSALAVDFPIGRDTAHIIDRGDLFAMPFTGVALLALNTALAVALHRSERAVAQVLMGGGLFLQGLLVVATIAAVD